MPTDAKCGLLVGVGLVLAVGVLFFQKEAPPAPRPAKASAPVAAVKPPDEPERSPLAPGRPVSRTADDPLQAPRP